MKPELLRTAEPEWVARKMAKLETLEPEAKVREELAGSRTLGAARPPPPFLREALEGADTRVPAEPARSHRKLVGPVLVGAKRAFRAAFQPLINEMLRAQVNFNERLVNAVALLHEELERQGRQDRRWRAEVEKRLEALERRRGGRE